MPQTKEQVIRDRELAKKAWWEGEVVFLNGTIVDKPLALILLGSTLLVLLIGCGLIGYFYWSHSGADEATPDASNVERSRFEDRVGPDGEPLSVTGVALLHHIHATGMAAFESLLIEGNYETRGIVFDYSALSRRGGLVRQTLRHEELEVLAGWNAQVYWEKNPLSELKDKAKLTRFVNAAMLRMQASPAAAAWQYLEEGAARLQWIERAEVDLLLCDVIRNDGLMEFPVRHYLCAESGREMRRETELQFESLFIPIRVDFTYRSGALANQIPGHFPSGYVLSVGEVEIAEATFTEVRPNVGTFSWMFDPVRE